MMSRKSALILGSQQAADPPAAPVGLALHGVTKHYGAAKGTLAAVANASLEITRGELTALMGPSGSGKTTLLSIMGGILRPTSGRVMICGQDVSDMDEMERSRVRLAHIGFIFQNYNLFPTLTAQQNVEIALDLKRITGRARQTQARELLDQVELCDKADVYPAELSGGQKQRVAIARALAGTPSIILADEPTAALDSTNGRIIMAIFRGIASAHRRAVVLVTHDSRILEFADRVISIEDGRIATDARKAHSQAPMWQLTGAKIRRVVLAETNGTP